MEGISAGSPATLFRYSDRFLANLDPNDTAAAIAAAADIALIIDGEGVIRDVAVRDPSAVPVEPESWLDRPWVDTVAEDSRSKVREMVSRTSVPPLSGEREVNHRDPAGADIPMSYKVVRLGSQDHLLAVGRDLKPISVMQQRLVGAQQAMEREYARLRHAETRYRLLFSLSSEPVLIVDAVSQTVAQANPAAAELLDVSARSLTGQPLESVFAADDWSDVLSMLASVRVAGREEGLRVRLARSNEEVTLSVSLFRQESGPLFLIRMASSREAGEKAGPRERQLVEIVESLPDAFVVVDPERRVLTANTAFLDLVELATEAQARGESLGQWLGRPGVDLNILMANIKEHGVVRSFATVMRGQFGSTSEVEVSGVATAHADATCFGFMIRPVTTRFPNDAQGHALPRSVEQLTNLVGRVPLKEIIRETTDVIESLCIEAALEVSGDNRASAAQLLGLSRQSLYAKLRRHGLGDLDPTDPQGTP